MSRSQNIVDPLKAKWPFTPISLRVTGLTRSRETTQPSERGGLTPPMCELVLRISHTFSSQIPALQPSDPATLSSPMPQCASPGQPEPPCVLTLALLHGKFVSESGVLLSHRSPTVLSVLFFVRLIGFILFLNVQYQKTHISSMLIKL